MSPDLSKAYDLLGVKPGVSNRELKAAHRDLAKVWHPDRFLHDPRLQEKAQEKLKEINEAYELLISGKTPRPAPSTSAQTAYAPPQRHATRPRTSFPLAVAMMIFIAGFAITINVLLKQRARLVQPETQVEQPTDLSQETFAPAEADSRSRAAERSARANTEDAPPEVSSTTSSTSEPTPTLATVTVAIDPESGLLAKADCPVRSRMTYPRGSEPTGYCSITHAPPPKESRIKSIAEKILPQMRKDTKEELKD